MSGSSSSASCSSSSSSSSSSAIRSWRTAFLTLRDESLTSSPKSKSITQLLNDLIFSSSRVLISAAPDLPSHEVEYDFTYYKMDMSADVQLLILSEGKSNILPANIILPIRPTDVCFPEAVSTETLEAWRWYLATMRTMPHSRDIVLKVEVERINEENQKLEGTVDQIMKRYRDLQAQLMVMAMNNKRAAAVAISQLPVLAPP